MSSFLGLVLSLLDMTMAISVLPWTVLLNAPFFRLMAHVLLLWYLSIVLSTGHE